MIAFAYISILEGAFKLMTAFIVLYFSGDRLILYALILMLISLVLRFIYGNYCNKHFDECTLDWKFDKSLLRQMSSFAGWNVIGATSAVCRDHGGNLLLNLYGGPTVNAARAIAVQVNTSIQAFVQNFQMAINPQIIKQYAINDLAYMHQLIYRGAKFSYFILLIIALPVILTSDYILSFWLGDYPAHTVEFLQLVLIFSLIETLSGPLVTSMYATGKVKNYQIVVGGLQMMNLPFSYILLYAGYASESIYVVAILISVFCLIARLFMLKPLIKIEINTFFKVVILRVALVTILSLVLPLFISNKVDYSFTSFVLLLFVTFIGSLFFIVILGLSKEERIVINSKIWSFIHKVKS
jgi:O-antigen/teichoic acid export membrane protein